MDMGTQPYALAREEGKAVWFLGTLVIMKATGEQTAGAFGLIDNLMPAEFAFPYHMHRNEDESFYVVEGEMTFYVGEQRLKAEAGAFVYGFIQSHLSNCVYQVSGIHPEFISLA